MKKGTILFLNGTSSAGKSTLSWEIQAQSERELYWLSNDAFTDMPHNSYYERDWKKTFDKAIGMLYQTAMLYLKNGIDVIIDHVLLYGPSRSVADLLVCAEQLRDAHVTFVFVSCPLPVLRERELARGDRNIGQAEEQFQRLLPARLYDITVDTTVDSTAQCARKVLQKQQELLQSGNSTAFDKIYETGGK